jgi:site-specific recombinase XerD
MHSLRHTVASRLLEVGVGFETISGLLGHRSLETTREYTRIDIDTLRTVALAPEDADHD